MHIRIEDCWYVGAVEYEVCGVCYVGLGLGLGSGSGLGRGLGLVLVLGLGFVTCAQNVWVRVDCSTSFRNGGFIVIYF